MKNTARTTMTIIMLLAVAASARAGLIGWWTLDGNLTDSSTTGLDAAPTVSAQYGAGQFGQAAACYDSTDACYNVADSAVWDTGSAVTVSH